MPDRHQALGSRELNEMPEGRMTSGYSVSGYFGATADLGREHQVKGGTRKTHHTLSTIFWLNLPVVYLRAALSNTRFGALTILRLY